MTDTPLKELMNAMYCIKYGNNLYYYMQRTPHIDNLWTHDPFLAIKFFSKKSAAERLQSLKDQTSLYAARVVAWSEIELVVDNVP